MNYLTAKSIIQLQIQRRFYMGTLEFDGKKYRAASKHQKEWGNELISELSFKGNETILDLGCGDGILTEQLSLAVPKGKVLGIDASLNMIQTARTINRNNLTFAHVDINEMNFENEFDLIFSNAALHWVKDHNQLLKNTYKALKTNGKILWDFGSSGNCRHFIQVIQGKIAETTYAEYFKNFDWPWYMPSKSQYSKTAAKVGFSSCTIEEINRDRYFSNASEMIQWIEQPSIVPFIKYIPQELREPFRQEVIKEMLNRTRQSNGTYFETFRRIKVYAEK